MATQYTPTAPPRLVPAKRAARELGIPYSTIRDSVHRGELAVIRLGRNERHAAWYFERRDLDSWIANRKGAA